MLPAWPQHPRRLPEIRDPVADVVNDVGRQHDVEPAINEGKRLRVPLDERRARRVCPRARQHLARGVDTRHGAAGLGHQRGGVVARAAADIEHPRLGVEQAAGDQRPQYAGVDTAVAGVGGGAMVVVELCLVARSPAALTPYPLSHCDGRGGTAAKRIDSPLPSQRGRGWG